MFGNDTDTHTGARAFAIWRRLIVLGWVYAIALNSQHAECLNDMNRHHYHQRMATTASTSNIKC